MGIMQIFVNAINGKTIACDVDVDTCVYDIKNQIIEQENIPYANQEIVYQAQKLEDSDNINDIMQEGNTFDLHINLKGGASSTMDPAIIELSKKYVLNKMICRKCYATLPPRAKKCRKAACGHWPDLRPRKQIKDKK